MAFKCPLSFWSGSDRNRLRTRILVRITGQQRSHGIGIGANFLHRSGEPNVDGAVHQPVGEPIHHHDWNERKQQRTDHHAGAELRSEHAQTPLGKQLEQIARQHKRERRAKSKEISSERA